MDVAVNFSLVFDQGFEPGKGQVALEAVPRTVKHLAVLLRTPGHLLAADAAVDPAAAAVVVHLGDVNVAPVEIRKHFSAPLEGTRQRIRWTSPSTLKR